MADNINVTPGTGSTIAADDIGGVLHQRVKLSQGADGSATDVSSAAPLNVTLANTGANATPVVVDLGANNDVALNAGTNYVGKVRLTDGTTDSEVVPLAGYNAQAVAIVDGSGAQITSFGGGVQYTEGDTDASITGTATMMEVAANTLQPIQGTVVDGLLVNLGANNDVTVTGTVTANLAAGTNNIGDVDVLTINGVAPAFGTGVRGATVQRVTIATDDSVPVTIASVPSHNVTNAGTFAVQSTNQANSGVDIGDVTINNAAGASAVNIQDGGNSITIDGTVAVSGTVAVTDNASSLTVDAPVGTPVYVRLSDGASAIATLPVSMATNTPLGTVAHDSADSGAPIKVGGRASSAEITAVTTGDRSDFITDLVGKQIILPYANNENFVSGAITTAMTGTTSTSLVAAPAAGLRNYITTIIVSNSHATVGTDVVIQDGSGGTTLLTIPAAAVYGGAVINLPVPLRQPTTATAIYCANVTTGASTKVSAVGYKGY